MINNSTLRCLLLTCLCVYAPFSKPHVTLHAHACDKPLRPAHINSMLEQEILQAKIAIFESCMFDFIREQQRQAQLHEQAAQTALEEWEGFFQ